MPRRTTAGKTGKRTARGTARGTRKTIASPTARKTARSTPRVRIRTYRHGLGDCHLLSFTKPNGSLCHVLIDCGVVNRTQNPAPLMAAVAKDVATVSNGVLDLVIATHQHTDHLSGFKQAEAEFHPDKVEMKRLWLAWTEKPGNTVAKQIKKELVNKLAAVRLAVGQMAGASASRVEGILDYFSPGVAGQDTQEILDMLQGRPDVEIDYHEPGDLLALPGVPNVRVYVLGPPTDPKDLKVTNPRKTKHEGYELAAAARGFVNALNGGTADSAEVELSYPFEQRYRADEAVMKQEQWFEWFQRYYLGTEPPLSPGSAAAFTQPVQDAKALASRTIDTSWLESAEQLALALGNYTNNTSLALAFEFIDTGEVLLFPGDAQIGSWNTWPKLEWKIRDGRVRRTVKIGDLFERTVFYKASHHASHNGTLSGLAEGAFGLEQMTHPDLVCVVPVDLAMSKTMNWDRTLPWKPLLTRLTEITRGRIVLTDRKASPPKAADLTALSPAERKRFAKQVTVKDQYVEYTR